MNNLIWFTNNLRTKDNLSLLQACQTSSCVYAIYFFNPDHFTPTKYGFKKTEKYRAKFLIETVQDLKNELSKLNINLFVYYDAPDKVLPQFIEQNSISTVYIQKEWTQEELNVLNNVKNKVQKQVAFVENYTQFLIHPEEVPYENFGSIPEVFTQFRKKTEKYSTVKELDKAPNKLPEKNLQENNTKIPTLEDLGFKKFVPDARSAFPFKGGENEAWKRLDHYFWETQQLKNYKKTRNGLVGTAYSSKLSAWLANGSISAKSIYWEVKKFEKEVKKNQDTYWLVFELFWRDYFKYVALKHGNKIFKLQGISSENYNWYTNTKLFEDWTMGNTPYDFVNANMKELLHTGWMSNRGRQNVASFWAKESLQDWRIGAAYFESMLIDYDVHSNWGNWMYNAGVGNDPRNRKFNIERQAAMYDPDHKFRNLWNS